MASAAAGDGGDVSVPWWRRKRPRPPSPPPEADVEVVKAEALELISALPVLPRLVVFDLDHTLWPYQCDRLPKDEIPYLYPQARGILNALKDKGIEMAIASRASRRGVAKSFLEKLGIHFMFSSKEIFYTWSPKGDHFENIHRKTGVPYQSMLFFDDEVRNIIATNKLGVCSVRVEKGMTLEKLRAGLSNFAKTSATPKAKSSGMGLNSFAKTSVTPKAEPTGTELSSFVNTSTAPRADPTES